MPFGTTITQTTSMIMVPGIQWLPFALRQITRQFSIRISVVIFMKIAKVTVAMFIIRQGIQNKPK